MIITQFGCRTRQWGCFCYQHWKTTCWERTDFYSTFRTIWNRFGWQVIPDISYQPSVEIESTPGPSGLCTENQNSKSVKKRGRVVIADEDGDDIFHKKRCWCQWSCLDQKWWWANRFVGVVEEKDPLKGYKVHVLVNFNGDWDFGTKMFIASSEPEPANNRLAWKLSDTDYVKYKNMK